jgi:hypothetical protein
MNIKRISKKTIEVDKDKFSEMESYYFERTKKHISLVQKYCDKIIKSFPEFYLLEKRKEVHDNSKFLEPELTPYVFITWKYKCKDSGEIFPDWAPKDIDKLMNEATIHHILYNDHHPDYWEKRKDVQFINNDNRDKPADLIDATLMPDISIAEMVADWCAVSDERKSSPKDWADKNINIRWKFNKEQEKLIYNIIKEIW